MRKRYRALCVGALAGEGTVEEPVSGKAAVTKYKVVECTPSGRYGKKKGPLKVPVLQRKVLIFTSSLPLSLSSIFFFNTIGFVTTVDLWPVTGRKHQLRRHLASLGHPILGDDRHGGPRHKASVRPGENMCLWALEVTLEHPTAATGLRLDDACAQEPLPPGWVQVSIAEPDLFRRVRRAEAAAAAAEPASPQGTAAAVAEEHDDKRARNDGPESAW